MGAQQRTVVGVMYSAGGALALGLATFALSGSWLSGLFGAACGASAFWIAREPRVGLLAILVTMPLDSYGRVLERPVIVTAFHVVLLITLGSWGWRVARGTLRIRWSAVDIGMALLLFAAVWSLPLSMARGATAVAAIRVAFSVAFVLLFVNLVDDAAWLRRLAIAFVVTVGLSGAVALLQYFVPGFPIPMLHADSLSDGTVVWRAAGLFHDPNFLGAVMSTAAVGLAAAATHARPWRRAAAWAAASAACGVVLALTLSRGSWVGTLVGLVAVALTAPPRRRAVIVVGGLVLAVVVALAAPQAVRERALSSFDVSRDLSAATRWKMFGSTAAMARDHWAFGVGLAAHDKAYPRYKAPGTQEGITLPHEVPVALVAETGLPGALAQIALIAGIVMELRRRKGTVRSAYGSIAVGALAALGAGMFFENFLYFEYVWLFVALAVVAGRVLPVAEGAPHE